MSKPKVLKGPFVMFEIEMLRASIQLKQYFQVAQFRDRESVGERDRWWILTEL